MLNIQVREMKSMSNSIQKLEGGKEMLPANLFEMFLFFFFCYVKTMMIYISFVVVGYLETL